MRLSIGKSIKIKRILQDLTQTELGQILGCSKQFIHLIETGQSDIPKSMKPKLEKVFNLDVKIKEKKSEKV